MFKIVGASLEAWGVFKIRAASLEAWDSFKMRAASLQATSKISSSIELPADTCQIKNL